MLQTMPHNWPRYWEEKAAYLRTGVVDWDNFRRDAKLMHLIQFDHIFDKAWKFCIQDGVPLITMEDSRVGNPIGQMREGLFMTASSMRAAHYMHRIFSHWNPPETFRILEIGGGFGAQARTILTWKSHIELYTLIDGDPCLEVQKRYFAMLPRAPVAYVPCANIHQLEDHSVDLVINTNSFSEMSLADVRGYFKLIQRVLSPGGALYTTNKSTDPPGISRVSVPFTDFPFDDRWAFVLKVAYLDHPHWIEAMAVRR